MHGHVWTSFGVPRPQAISMTSLPGFCTRHAPLSTVLTTARARTTRRSQWPEVDGHGKTKSASKPSKASLSPYAQSLTRPASAAELGHRRAQQPSRSRGPRTLIEHLKNQALETDVHQLQAELELTGKTLSEANLRLEEERKTAAKLAVETERLRGREEDLAAAEEARERMQLLERERLARAAVQLSAQRAQLDEQLRKSARTAPPPDNSAQLDAARQRHENELQELRAEACRAAQAHETEKQRLLRQLEVVAEEKVRGLISVTSVTAVTLASLGWRRRWRRRRRRLQRERATCYVCSFFSSHPFRASREITSVARLQ